MGLTHMTSRIQLSLRGAGLTATLVDSVDGVAVTSQVGEVGRVFVRLGESSGDERQRETGSLA
jgi:hypothetical protein